MASRSLMISVLLARLSRETSFLHSSGVEVEDEGERETNVRPRGRGEGCLIGETGPLAPIGGKGAEEGCADSVAAADAEPVGAADAAGVATSSTCIAATSSTASSSSS